MIKYLVFDSTMARADCLREYHNLSRKECKLISFSLRSIKEQIIGYYNQVKNGEIKLVGWTFKNFAEAYGFSFKTKLDLE